MLNPIEASANIKDEYVGYITTSFNISDKVYAAQFAEELQGENGIAKGPYLEIGDSFEQGESMHALINNDKLSKLFFELEKDKPESKKEFQLERALYLHQEQAIKKINNHRNIVVTTGTGSGKTECFIIPIINELLREKEAGSLSAGVRAILIYPMNALANDQMKRLRELLSNYEDIRFGVYNGNTKQTDIDGIEEYGRVFKDTDGSPLKPLKNEVISRDSMQAAPPHILVTNYAMLEYMLLRPKDDLVFSGADLKFIVLDEAHIYRGTTGMETSLLMRRLKARISNPENVLHIVTSATLGDEDANADIVRFAKELCGADFSEDDIIRSVMKKPEYDQEEKNLPLELFSELAKPDAPLNIIANRYGMDIPQGVSDEQFIYDLCLNSSLYRAIRNVMAGPATIHELAEKLKENFDVSEQDIINFISVAVLGVKNNTALVKARYHLFTRAIEGAYITLNHNKRLSLVRNRYFNIDGEDWKGFEAAVCDDCGRVAVTGELCDDETLEFKSPSNEDDAVYYMLTDEGDADFVDDEETDNEEELGKNDYLICAKCGTVVHKSLKQSISCGHSIEDYVSVFKAEKRGKNSKCPCCSFGNFRDFYLGYDSATAVLGTSLFEQLPETEIVLKSKEDKDSGKGNNLFGRKTVDKAEKIKKNRQFLSFSDSRGEAAFFACYMEDSYQEFLRRRGIWHVVTENKQSMSTNPWEIKDFVNALSDYFEANRSFADAGDKGTENISGISKKMAWIAILNEMVNARRASSMASLGMISFEYKGNDEEIMSGVAGQYNKDVKDVKALFDLLVMDIVYHGAIEGDCKLTDDEKEYIFYTAVPKRVRKARDLVKDKGKSGVMGFMANTTKNGKYRRNGRLIRCMDVLGLGDFQANELLEMYWDNVLKDVYSLEGDETGGYYFKTDSFVIRAGGEQIPFYECEKCGRTTTYNCGGKCASVRCSGKLIKIDRNSVVEKNHYARLYSSDKMKPLHIKEHTAQLGRREQEKYQEMFVKKELNALSCSTTFEMGVDVGDLETVYLRDVPPTPSNYVQRAGRAGRSRKSAAYTLTYAKLASHDFTYFNDPIKMISGQIGVPLFAVKNEKVILRHIFAVAISAFFAENEDVYCSNNATVLLNEDGYERLKAYLNDKPDDLKDLLMLSIPADMHETMGINDFSWTDKLIGQEGVLEVAVESFKTNVKWYEGEIERYAKNNDFEAAGKKKSELRRYRRSKEDNDEGRVGQNDLIEFLVRNNVLPKYGFPVDTAELYQGIFATQDKELQMVRDLQLAIGEYAPDSQVVADGKLFTSRYIRKLPNATGHVWETVYIAKCPNPSCQSWNYSITNPAETGKKCVCCGEMITRGWEQAIEPRQGFIADSRVQDVPMHKPKRVYKSDDYYVGDINRQSINRYEYTVGGSHSYVMETSANDSLMVKCNDDFFVCETCGYAESKGQNYDKQDRFRKFIERDHTAPWGKECKHKLKKSKLCHVFKTDVVNLTFLSKDAADLDTMLSVMYALLEAVSKTLDIERNDLKGCLHKVRYEGRLINSIILYDAVAGGAGHVRRLATEDGEVFQRVLESAINLTGNCSCSPSCYNCLRNYYNQKFHDRLDRIKAKSFLENYYGEITKVVIPDEEREDAIDSEVTQSQEKVARQIHFRECGKNLKSKSVESIWQELLEDATDKDRKVIDEILSKCGQNMVKPISGEIAVFDDEDTFEINLLWKDQKIMFFLEDYQEDYYKAKETDFKCYSVKDGFDIDGFVESISK